MALVYVLVVTMTTSRFCLRELWFSTSLQMDGSIVELVLVLKHYLSNQNFPLKENNVSVVQKGQKKTKKDLQPDATVVDFLCCTNFKLLTNCNIVIDA